MRIEDWLALLWSRLPGHSLSGYGEDEDHTEIVSGFLSYAYLLAKSPELGVPSRISLPSDRRITVGRNRHQCDIVIREHSISRRHSELFCENGDVYIRNLSQKGGTFVNRKRLPVDHPHQLQTGDVVHFYKYEYHFYFEDELTSDMGEPDTVNTPVEDDYYE